MGKQDWCTVFWVSVIAVPCIIFCQGIDAFWDSLRWFQKLGLCFLIIFIAFMGILISEFPKKLLKKYRLKRWANRRIIIEKGCQHSRSKVPLSGGRCSECIPRRRFK